MATYRDALPQLSDDIVTTDGGIEVDEGNPVELAQQHRLLFDRLKNLSVLDGCCGTDLRHIEAICKIGLQYRSNAGLST